MCFRMQVKCVYCLSICLYIIREPDDNGMNSLLVILIPYQSAVPYTKNKYGNHVELFFFFTKKFELIFSVLSSYLVG